MRLHGYCQSCHTIRLLTIRGTLPLAGNTPYGICDECEEKNKPQIHDADCELRPGGKYYGRKLGGRPIPCHCEARASGRRRADQENKRPRP